LSFPFYTFNMRLRISCYVMVIYFVHSCNQNAKQTKRNDDAKNVFQQQKSLKYLDFSERLVVRSDVSYACHAVMFWFCLCTRAFLSFSCCVKLNTPSAVVRSLLLPVCVSSKQQAKSAFCLHVSASPPISIVPREMIAFVLLYSCNAVI
jgi:hypothetical protein